MEGEQMMTGYVIDSNNGEKVGGATVSAENSDSGAIVATTSADDGSFTLDVSSGADYTISASKEGYSSLAIEQPGEGSGDTATVDDVLVWPT
jgi:hypothetical protein